jgi:hypothetical protein
MRKEVANNMKKILFILLIPFILSNCSLFKEIVPPYDVYTYIWMNPMYPTTLVIPKGQFTAENKGEVWFETKEDMNKFFEELYDKMYPQEPEPESKEDKTNT